MVIDIILILVWQLRFRVIENGEELFKWHNSSDYVSSKIEIGNGKFGNGIFAKEAIHEGEILFTIQPKNIIDTDYARQVQCDLLSFPDGDLFIF